MCGWIFYSSDVSYSVPPFFVVGVALFFYILYTLPSSSYSVSFPTSSWCTIFFFCMDLPSHVFSSIPYTWLRYLWSYKHPFQERLVFPLWFSPILDLFSQWFSPTLILSSPPQRFFPIVVLTYNGSILHRFSQAIFLQHCSSVLASFIYKGSPLQWFFLTMAPFFIGFLSPWFFLTLRFSPTYTSSFLYSGSLLS